MQRPVAPARPLAPPAERPEPSTPALVLVVDEDTSPLRPPKPRAPGRSEGESWALDEEPEPPVAPPSRRERRWRHRHRSDVAVALSVVVWLLAVLLPMRDVLTRTEAPWPDELPLAVRDLAALLWILCLVPTLLYLLHPPGKRRPIPFMPLSGILYGLYYPLAPLLGVDNLWSLGDRGVGGLDPARDYERAVQLALVGWLALGLGYFAIARIDLPGARGTARIGARLSPRVLYWCGLLALYGGMLGEICYEHFGKPFLLKSAAHFAAQLECLGIVLLAVLAARRQLRWPQHALFLAGFLSAAFLQLSTGASWKEMYVLFSFLLGYWVARRVVAAWWVLAGGLALAFFVCIRGAQTEWRERVWFGNPTLLEYNEDPGPLGVVSIWRRSAYMLELIRKNVGANGSVGAVEKSWDLIARRSALDPLADVIRRTPVDVPYWDGATYRSLVGVAVPRVLWPDKPQKTLGQDFGHRYSYLALDDRFTAINLPFLVEFYANFGETGVLCGMLLVGILFNVLEQYINRPAQSLLVTLGGAALIFPLLNIENDFSSQFGGLLLHAAALRLLAWTLEQAVSPMNGLITRRRRRAESSRSHAGPSLISPCPS